MDWTGASMTSVGSIGSTPGRSSPEDESLLSIFDCYGDRSLYRSLRAQFQIEGNIAKRSTVSDAPT